MTATTKSTALATIQPAFSDPERLALAGYLAGYRGLTREAYALDLRQLTTWCRARSLPCSPSAAPTSSASPATWKLAAGPAPPSPGGCAPSPGFCKYAVEEELLDHSPAAHVRRPRLDYESHATALDRNELGALLVAAGLVQCWSWRRPLAGAAGVTCVTATVRSSLTKRAEASLAWPETRKPRFAASYTADGAERRVHKV